MAGARHAMCELAFSRSYDRPMLHTHTHTHTVLVIRVTYHVILDNDQLDTHLLYFTVRLL
jgi:hypothetical protein